MSIWFQREFFDVLREERGVTWGRELHLFEEVGSTNDEALKAVLTRAPTGSVWLARSQTTGRGRRGSLWHDRPGESLLLSCLLRYTGPPERFLGLSLVVGLAVREAVLSRLSGAPDDVRVEIKWPNDVYVGGKKIAGVLVETRTGPSGELGTVIGIGLNLKSEDFPIDVPAATSLFLLGAEEAKIRPEVVLVVLLGALEKMLGVFLKQGFSPFAQELACADYLEGKLLRVGRIEGTGAGFDAEGRLLVATPEGVFPVISGTVELL